MAEAAPLEGPRRVAAGGEAPATTAEANTGALGAISFALAHLPRHVLMSAICAPCLTAAFNSSVEFGKWDVRRFGADYASESYIDQDLDALT